jgi:hypothetical protein
MCLLVPRCAAFVQISPLVGPGNVVRTPGRPIGQATILFQSQLLENVFGRCRLVIAIQLRFMRPCLHCS